MIEDLAVNPVTGIMTSGGVAGKGEPDGRARGRRRLAARRGYLRSGGCRGWSVGVYNPDLDPEGRAARQVVTFLAEVVGAGHGAR